MSALAKKIETKINLLLQNSEYYTAAGNDPEEKAQLLGQALEDHLAGAQAAIVEIVKLAQDGKKGKDLINILSSAHRTLSAQLNDIITQRMVAPGLAELAGAPEPAPDQLPAVLPDLLPGTVSFIAIDESKEILEPGKKKRAKKNGKATPPAPDKL